MRSAVRRRPSLAKRPSLALRLPLPLCRQCTGRRGGVRMGEWGEGPPLPRAAVPARWAARGEVGPPDRGCIRVAGEWSPHPLVRPCMVVCLSGGPEFPAPRAPLAPLGAASWTQDDMWSIAVHDHVRRKEHVFRGVCKQGGVGCRRSWSRGQDPEQERTREQGLVALATCDCGRSCDCDRGCHYDCGCGHGRGRAHCTGSMRSLPV